jgi:hypothetical protein
MVKKVSRWRKREGGERGEGAEGGEVKNGLSFPYN